MSKVVIDASAVLALLNQERLNQPVITTDRLWSSLSVGIEIRVVR